MTRPAHLRESCAVRRATVDAFPCWRDTFSEGDSDYMKPLGNTLAKPGQGVPGYADFPAGTYPACSEHGAMNKVAPAPLWRCPTCNIGVEIAQ